MDRVCINKATGRVTEMQSGGDDRPDLMEMRLNTLRQNALNAGYTEDQFECKWVTAAELAVLMQPTPEEVAVKEAEKARIAAKAQAIATNLPSWSQVDAAVTAISSLADAKAFIRKLARVVYWLAKDSAE